MKPSQSSIYRDLELLMQWYLPIGNKMPKEQALQNLGNSFQQELIEAMRMCRLALKSSDNKKSQCEFIDLIVFHLEGCHSVFGLLHEYKSDKGPIISHTQFANYLERTASLNRQIGGWRKKAASQTS
ncbi:MAG: hypothetical protein IJQ11_09950 [Bacteroidales bacterium]|nr:hypothetical protein [Bacteroidales bacterium]